MRPYIVNEDVRVVDADSGRELDIENIELSAPVDGFVTVRGSFLIHACDLDGMAMVRFTEDKHLRPEARHVTIALPLRGDGMPHVGANITITDKETGMPVAFNGVEFSCGGDTSPKVVVDAVALPYPQFTDTYRPGDAVNMGVARG